MSPPEGDRAPATAGKFLLSSSQEKTQGPDAPDAPIPPEHDFYSGWDATKTAPPCSMCGTEVWPDGLCVACELGGPDAA